MNKFHYIIKRRNLLAKSKALSEYNPKLHRADWQPSNETK